MMGNKKEKEELRGKNLVELEAILQRAGFEGFRAKQVYQWLYCHDIRNFEEMKNIPAALRAWLVENFGVGGVQIIQTLTDADGTKKILFSLQDGLHIEGVLMPKGRRWTLCISSQVGCRFACTFCLTGRVHFRRNLTSAEIIDQVQCARREILNGESPTNIVLMGMGEPLDNINALIPALHLLTAPQGIAIPTRRITVSTAGVVPGIIALAEAKTGVNLAISLGAANDALRSRLMPINKKYPLPELIKSCQKFPLDNRRRITFEYILLAGVNDSMRDMKNLVSLLQPVRCKINLLCFNEDTRLPFKPSPPETIERFRDYLTEKGFVVAVRYSMGRGVKGACGQLAANYLIEPLSD
jgi:23S rRNA (adenine2503-C2)-methyltransferase